MKKLYIFFLFISLVSCDKLLEIDPPAERLVTENVFSSNSTVNAASLGLYSLIQILESPYGTYQSLYADVLLYNSSNADIQMFASNALNSRTVGIYNLWKPLYSAIYKSNQILEALPTASNISDSVRQRAKGEALFFRSFAYFHLVNLWGDVPLVLTTNVTETSRAPRSPIQAIITQVQQDLLAAKEVLKPTYGVDDPFRVNRNAATALLARVYLYQKDWTNAEKEATEIISGRQYGLPAPATVFLASSKETILSAWNQNGFTPMGSLFPPASPTARPNYHLSKNLMTTLRPSDMRTIQWTKSVTVSGITYPYVNKYKAKSATTGSGAEYAVIFRLGEQFLIRGEARANLGNLSGAYLDIDTLRKRASSDLLPVGLNREELLLEIEAERFRELFMEGFHRFFDLKRTGRIDQVLGAAKSGWKESAAVFPIPLDEILRNPAISQNKDYQ